MGTLVLDKEVIDALNNPKAVKVLATVGSDGVPHVVFKGSLHANVHGYVEYWELIESSQTNKNMVHSIWFGKQIAISVLLEHRSWQIKGIPYRAIIAGQEFELCYNEVQEKLDTDLSTVWLIEVQSVVEESFEKRQAEELAAHPILQHVDRVLDKAAFA